MFDVEKCPKCGSREIEYDYGTADADFYNCLDCGAEIREYKTEYGGKTCPKCGSREVEIDFPGEDMDDYVCLDCGAEFKADKFF